MAEPFVLNAQINLRGVVGLDKISTQIKKAMGKTTQTLTINISQGSLGNLKKLENQLYGINKALVSVRGNVTTVAAAFQTLGNTLNQTTSQASNFKSAAGTMTKGMQGVAASTKQASHHIESFAQRTALTIKRFSSFIIASNVVGGFTRAVQNSFSEALKFQDSLVKLSQVTGDSLKAVKSIGDEVTRLSISFGVSSSELLGVAKILKQAEFSTEETTTALKTLAQTALSVSFDSLTDTAEAFIAIKNQFKFSVNETAIAINKANEVAKQYAVEAGDITAGVRRAGSAFHAAGGNIEEFIALLTSVRQTTRLSAESIATGFNTIFTRIQRPQTIQQLETLGITLRNLNGEFVGPTEAIRKIGEALSSVSTKGTQFTQIAEELGGYRQIRNVIPLITNLSLQQRVLNTAKNASNSLDRDAAAQQQSYITRLTKIREQLQAIFRTVVDSGTFNILISGLAKVTDAFSKLVKAAEPVLPIFAGLVALSVAKFSIRTSGALAAGLLGRGSGGPVPGIGNKDTVPARLTPGEFVIRKSAAQKIGSYNLHQLNSLNSGGYVMGFARGGNVGSRLPSSFTYAGTSVPYSDLRGQEYETPHILSPGSQQQSSIPIIKATSEALHATSIQVVEYAKKTKEPVTSLVAVQQKAVGTTDELMAAFDQLAVVTNNLANTLDPSRIATSPNKLAGTRGVPQGALVPIEQTGQNLVKNAVVQGNTKEFFAKQRLGTYEVGEYSDAGVPLADVPSGIGSYDVGNLREERRIRQRDIRRAKAAAKRASLEGKALTRDYANALNDQELSRIRDVTLLERASNVGVGSSALSAPISSGAATQKAMINSIRRKQERQAKIAASRNKADRVAKEGIFAGAFSAQEFEAAKYRVKAADRTKGFISDPFALFYKSKHARDYDPYDRRDLYLDQEAYLAKDRRHYDVSHLTDDRGRLRDETLNYVDPESPLPLPKQGIFSRLFGGFGGGGGGGPPGGGGGPPGGGGRLRRFANRLQSNRASAAGAANTLSLLAGGVGLLLGNTDESEQRLDKGDASATVAFQTKSAFASGATGAILGGQAGSFLGPVGTAVGAVAGGLIGALTGLSSAAKEAQEKLTSFAYNKSFKQFTKVIEGALSGKTTIGNAQIGAGITNIRNRFISAGTADRSDLNANISATITNLGQLAHNIAATSEDLDDFSNRGGKAISEFVNEFGGIPLGDFAKDIEATIQLNKNRKKAEQAQGEASAILTRQNSVLAAFTGALQDASDAADGVGRRFDALQGNIKFSGVPGLGNVFGRPESISNFSQYGAATRQIGGFLGPEGGKIANDLQATVEAFQLLPGILTEFATNPSTTDPGSFVAGKLKGAVSNDTISVITAAIADKITGGTDAQPKFIQDILGNAAGVSKDLFGGTQFTQNAQLLDVAAKQFIEKINNLGDRYAVVVAKELEIRESKAEILKTAFDRESQIRELRLGRTTVAQANASSLAQQQAVLGPNAGLAGNAAGILKAITSGRSNLVKLNEGLNKANSADEVKKFQEAIADTKSTIESLEKAFQILADKTKQISIIQDKLAKVRAGREQATGLAQDYIFADNDSRRQLNRIAGLALGAGQQGNLNKILAKDRGGIRSFLQGIGDVSLPIFGKNTLTGQDKTGRDILNDITSGELQKQFGLDKGKADQIAGKINTPKEEKLISDLDSLFKEEQSLRNALLVEQAKQPAELRQVLKDEFNKFLSNLNNNLASSTNRGLDQRIGEAQTKIKLARSQQEAFTTGTGIDLSGFGKVERENILGLVKQKKDLGSLPATIDEYRNIFASDISGGELSSSRASRKNRSALFDAIGGTGLYRGAAPQGFGNDVTVEAARLRANELIEGFSKRFKLGDKEKIDLRGNIFGGLNTEAGAGGTLKAENANEIIAAQLRDAFFAIDAQTKTKKDNLTSGVGALSSEGRALFDTLSGYNNANLQAFEESMKRLPDSFKALQPEIEKLQATIKLLESQKIVVPQPGQPLAANGNLPANQLPLANAAMSSLGNNIASFTPISQALGASMDNFPRTLEMTANHKVEVILNGADVLAQLQPSIQELIVGEANKALSKFAANVLPGAGAFA